MFSIYVKRRITQFIAVFFLAWTGFAHAGLERWEQGGLEGAYNNGLLAVDVGGTGTVNTLYAGTWGAGILKSTWSNSTGWSVETKDNAGLGNLRIRTLIKDGSTLYAGTDGAGVWTATLPANNTLPLSWSQMNPAGLNCTFVTNFAVRNGTIYASARCGGGSSGIYRFIDQTTGWVRAGANNLPSGIQVGTAQRPPSITGTACSGSHHCLYIPTSQGIYFNKDGTSTTEPWTPILSQPVGADGQNEIGFIVPILNGTTLYLMARVIGGGIQQATVQTTNPAAAGDFTTVNSAWIAPAGQPSLNTVGAIGNDPLAADRRWVIYPGYGAYRLNDIAGLDTNIFRAGQYQVGSDRLPALRSFFRPRDGAAPEPNGSGNMLVARTVEGVYWYDVPSARWSKIPSEDESSGIETSAGNLNGIYADPQAKVLVAVSSGSVFVGRDLEAVTKLVLPGAGEIGRTPDNVLAVDKTFSSTDPTLYVSTNSTGIFKSFCLIDCDFSTNTFSGLPNLAGLTPGILLDPNDNTSPQTLFLYTDRRYPGETIGRGVWTSTDGANTWTNFSGALTTAQKHVTAAAIASDGTLIIGTRDNSVYKSSTGAASWTLLFTLPTVASHSSRITSIAVDGTDVYLGVVVGNSLNGADATNTGVYKGTTTGGFAKIAAFPAGIKPSTIAVTNNGGTKTIWVGAKDDSIGGIYKSTDNGTTWLTTNTKLAGRDINSFGVNNSGGTQTLFAAGSVGNGLHFRAVQNGPDFNNDGKADIFWRKTDGANALWMMDGLSVRNNTVLNTVSAAGWSLVGTGDFNGDGHTDVLWRNGTSGDNAIWLLNHGEIISSALIDNVPAGWDVVGVGDFDGDGKSDLLWRNGDTNAIWFMDGSTRTSSSLINSVPTSWAVIGVNDFDGDGKADIFWRNASSGDNAVWLMSGATLASSALLGNVAGPDWNIMGIGDMDGDGKSDVVWRNTSTGDNAIWLINGTTHKSSAVVNNVSPTGWSIVGIGDYNGDYMNDILWRNSITGANYSWTMNGFTIQSQCGALQCTSGYLPGVESSDWSVVNK